MNRARRIAGIVLATFALLRCAADESALGPGANAGDAGRDVVLLAEGGRFDEDAGSDAGECTRRVVIGEVMVSGATAGEEFIELANAGTCAASIAGWSLRYRSASDVAGPTLVTFDPGEAIVAGGVLVVATASFALDGGAAYEFTAGLAAAGGQIGLLDDQGGIVDAVGYGTAQGAYVEKAPAPAPPANASIARKKGGADTNDNAADFVVRATPTPGAPDP